MKISRPNNWVWHQMYASRIPYNEKGTGYVLVADTDAAEDRVAKLRAVVTEVTGMPTAPTKGSAGFR